MGICGSSTALTNVTWEDAVVAKRLKKEKVGSTRLVKLIEGATEEGDDEYVLGQHPAYNPEHEMDGEQPEKKEKEIQIKKSRLNEVNALDVDGEQPEKKEEEEIPIKKSTLNEVNALDVDVDMEHSEINATIPPPRSLRIVPPAKRGGIIVKVKAGIVIKTKSRDEAKVFINVFESGTMEKMVICHNKRESLDVRGSSSKVYDCLMPSGLFSKIFGAESSSVTMKAICEMIISRCSQQHLTILGPSFTVLTKKKYVGPRVETLTVRETGQSSMDGLVPELFSGDISKRGHNFHTKKARHFVLSAGCMSYYEKESMRPPLGVNKKGLWLLHGYQCYSSTDLETIEPRPATGSVLAKAIEAIKGSEAQYNLCLVRQEVVHGMPDIYRDQDSLMILSSRSVPPEIWVSHFKAHIAFAASLVAGNAHQIIPVAGEGVLSKCSSLSIESAPWYRFLIPGEVLLLSAAVTKSSIREASGELYNILTRQLLLAHDFESKRTRLMYLDREGEEVLGCVEMDLKKVGEAQLGPVATLVDGDHSSFDITAVISRENELEKGKKIEDEAEKAKSLRFSLSNTDTEGAVRWVQVWSSLQWLDEEVVGLKDVV